MRVNTHCLVADIGGTNARFALLEGESEQPIAAETLACADYPTLVDAVRAYLASVPFAQPSEAVLAIATAVVGDQVSMTNHVWQFSISASREALGLERLTVLNDFTALALAVPHLPDTMCHPIGGGQAVAQCAKALIGPGTGLGVSGVIPLGDTWVPLQGEGGHVAYGGCNEREFTIIQTIRNQSGSVTAESLLSGDGLVLMYQTLVRLRTGQDTVVKPWQVTQRALEGSCLIAVDTVALFCEILGRVARDLALTLGARGGVYIGGGIVPQMLELFSQSKFRARFQQHGRFEHYLRDIPTYVIVSDYPALLGAALVLQRAEYQGLGITCSRGSKS